MRINLTILSMNLSSCPKDQFHVIAKAFYTSFHVFNNQSDEIKDLRGRNGRVFKDRYGGDDGKAERSLRKVWKGTCFIFMPRLLHKCKGQRRGKE